MPHISRSEYHEANSMSVIFRFARPGVRRIAVGAVYFFFLEATQPSLLIWRPRAMARDSGGTSSVTDEPAATYAFLPMRTGAINWESVPTNAPSSITVGFLLTPS